MKYLHFLILLLFLYCCQATGKKKEIVDSPAGYDLSTPEKFLMPEELDELSGISYFSDPQILYAVNDEEGKIYQIELGKNNKTKPFKFTKKGDFEDLASDGQYWYALKSSGKLLRIFQPFTDSFQVREFEYPEKKNEFEAVFFDPVKKKIIMLCKLCSPSADGKIPAYSLDTVNSAFVYEPEYSPDSNVLKKIIGKTHASIRPSGAAFHPITGELYILSIHDRMLLIMKDGILKNAYSLPKKTFRQPEGITFSPNGDMYISNEAVEAIANVLKFSYQPGTTISVPPKP